MTTKYTVAFPFAHGVWTFREGETYTPAEAADAGLEAADLEHHQRRGNLKTDADLAYDAAEASRLALGAAAPPPPEDPTAN